MLAQTASDDMSDGTWTAFKRQILTNACSGLRPYDHFSNLLRNWGTIKHYTIGCENSLLTSLLQLWHVTKLFETAGECISETELVRIFLDKLGDERASNFLRIELCRGSSRMTLRRLRKAIDFATRSRGVSGTQVSEHFPDSHHYSLVGSGVGSGHFNRIQREEADSTAITDEQIKSRKTVKLYRKERKATPPPSSDTSSDEVPPESRLEPTPKVTKTLKAKPPRKRRGEFGQRGNYFQGAATDSVVIKEQRASRERTSRERPLYQGPDSRGRKDREEGSRDAQGQRKDREERPRQERTSDRAATQTTVIASHLRKRPVDKSGNPEPPYHASCFWCSTRYINGLTIIQHHKYCPSRISQIRACRGCHKEFQCLKEPPWMSEDYVRHICHCPHLRCRSCDSPDNKHDAMVCPRKTNGCVMRGQTSDCSTGHIRGFCSWDKKIARWLRGK